MKINTYNELITLIQPIVSSSGEAETSRQIYACIASVGYNEFYSATQAGLQPEIKFILPDADEYKNEPIVEYGGKRYNVIRFYRTGFQQMELTCERVRI